MRAPCAFNAVIYINSNGTIDEVFAPFSGESLGALVGRVAIFGFCWLTIATLNMTYYTDINITEENSSQPEFSPTLTIGGRDARGSRF